MEHNRGQTKSTRFGRPYRLMFVKEYLTSQEAKRIELKLKKFKSREVIDKIIAEKEIRLEL